MSNKERLAIELAKHSGMKLSVEGTHLHATLYDVSSLVCKLTGNRSDDYVVEAAALDAGWLWYDAELYGDMDALINLIDAACGTVE